MIKQLTYRINIWHPAHQSASVSVCLCVQACMAGVKECVCVITLSPQSLQTHFPQQIKCVSAATEHTAKLKSPMLWHSSVQHLNLFMCGITTKSFFSRRRRGKNGHKTKQVQTLKETLVAVCCTHGGSDFSSDLESAEVDFWGFLEGVEQSCEVWEALIARLISDSRAAGVSSWMRNIWG